MQIYYVDETGISTIHKPAKVVEHCNAYALTLQRGGRLIQCYIMCLNFWSYYYNIAPSDDVSPKVSVAENIMQDGTQYCSGYSVY